MNPKWLVINEEKPNTRIHFLSLSLSLTHTHTHTHTQINKYIAIVIIMIIMEEDERKMIITVKSQKKNRWAEQRHRINTKQTHSENGWECYKKKKGTDIAILFGFQMPEHGRESGRISEIPPRRPSEYISKIGSISPPNNRPEWLGILDNVWEFMANLGRILEESWGNLGGIPTIFFYLNYFLFGFFLTLGENHRPAMKGKVEFQLFRNCRFEFCLEFPRLQTRGKKLNIWIYSIYIYIFFTLLICCFKRISIELSSNHEELMAQHFKRNETELWTVGQRCRPSRIHFNV